MRQKVLSLTGGIELVALLMIISGCASTRISLADQGYISVEKRGSEEIRILWADVYQQNGQTWTYVVLKQPSSIGGTIKTHLDIQILSPDRSVQYKTGSKDIYVPRERTGRMGWKKVRVKLSDDILEGSRVLVEVHSGVHENCFKKE